MTERTCLSSEYQNISGHDRLLAVTLFNERIAIKSRLDALRAVCQKLITIGRLTPKDVRRFGWAWLTLNPQSMLLPLELAHGIYIAADGSGITPLLRVDVLLRRLMIPPSTCVYTYINGGGTKDVVTGKVDAAAYLKEWDESQEEPDGNVQKRLHEFSQNDLLNFTPYKMGVGRDRYAVDSWAEVFDALVAYIYLFYGKSGPARLLNLQHSNFWVHGQIIKNDVAELRMVPIDKALGANKIFAALKDLIAGIGFDQYSIYLKCAPSMGTPDVVEPSDDLEESGNTKMVPDEQPVLSPLPPSPAPSTSLEDKVDFGAWRHLRPKVILR